MSWPIPGLVICVLNTHPCQQDVEYIFPGPQEAPVCSLCVLMPSVTSGIKRAFRQPAFPVQIAEFAGKFPPDRDGYSPFLFDKGHRSEDCDVSVSFTAPWSSGKCNLMETSASHQVGEHPLSPGEGC